MKLLFYISAHQTAASTTFETSSQTNKHQLHHSVPDANDKLKRYLQANDSLRDDEDLFMFWKRQKAFYPTLYSIVCEILIIPATKTAAERLLSASGNTITNTRTRLCTLKSF
ncbi:unnamed protein product [Rotaria sp. Silwood1]|nr:unnamed protein product [Rotaria sp. Silwood1]